jgi:hypothetical protein
MREKQKLWVGSNDILAPRPSVVGDCFWCNLFPAYHSVTSDTSLRAAPNVSQRVMSDPQPERAPSTLICAALSNLSNHP